LPKLSFGRINNKNNKNKFLDKTNIKKLN